MRHSNPVMAWVGNQYDRNGVFDPTSRLPRGGSFGGAEAHDGDHLVGRPLQPSEQRRGWDVSGRLLKVTASPISYTPKWPQAGTRRTSPGSTAMRVWVGRYRASIYREGAGWAGAISLGFGPDGRRRRLKRKAPAEQALMEKLIQAVDDLENGVRAERHYTVERAVNDLLRALAKADVAPSTVQSYQVLVELHLIPQIGRARVRDLSADDVEEWLFGRAEKLATSSLRIVHGLLTRALRRAQRHDKVARNVSALVDTPRGRPGRPSMSLSVEQALALLTEAFHGGHRLGPYVALGLLTGLRTEELRALRWDQVDMETAAILVTRSDRHRGDTKTPGSRRGLRVCQLAVDALKAARAVQAADKIAARAAYRDHGLVFSRPDGSLLTAAQVRRRFKVIADAAGLGRRWCPRELRHTFVSLLSDDGVHIDKISDLVGHGNTVVTQTVYRQQLRPVIEGGAERMQDILGDMLAASA